MEVDDPRATLNDLFQAALSAADPANVLARHLPDPPTGRTVVIGAGKASAAMAKALEEAWTGTLDGLVVTRYGHAVPCARIEIVEAAHPVPDAAGLGAAERILKMMEGLTEDDLVIALISGGGSSLLTLPAPGLTLADKQAINTALLKSGAPIDQMNAVRKHLSAIKGGRLAAAAHPARVMTLTISDVPGDDPAVIASGPTVGDTTTADEALAILEHHTIPIPDAVRAVLTGPDGETPNPDDPRLARAEVRMIATPQMALDAAAASAREAGLHPIILGDAIEGEARDVAADMIGTAYDYADARQPGDPPIVLLSGGETTVTVRGNGRGGRNAEFLLALAIGLSSAPGFHAIACDTDGIDGSEDNAGAICGPDTLDRARQSGLDAEAFLANNDGYSFFEALGDLVVTGPTLTNVNDFRAILIT